MTTGPSTTTPPYILAVEPNVRFVSILSVGDSVGTKPDGTPWKMVGIPDGLGALDNGDGTLTVLMNHEIGNTQGVIREHGSIGSFVSQLTIDKATLAVTRAEDLAKAVFQDNDGDGVYVQATTAWNRFCSGDLAEGSAFYNAATGLGTTQRLYITGEEAGAEGRAFAFVADGPDAGKAYELPRLGNMSFENLLASPGSGDKTVVIATDDSTPGQVYLYVGAKQAAGSVVEQAGLTNGLFYGIKVPEIGVGAAAETAATSFGADGASTFTLAALGNVATQTGAQIETASDAAGVSEFFRPEDGAWDPTNPNWFYFVTTASFDQPSRLYRLEFTDINNPTAGGTIRMLLDGTEGQHMFDNIDVGADGTVYLQEDPGSNPYLAKVWAYDPSSDFLAAQGQFDPALFLPGNPGFLTQDEESSGIVDVSSILGDSDTRAYLLDVQAHYSLPGELVQGGQLLAMYVDDPFLVGGNKSDSLFGSAANETFRGNNGDDSARAGSGNDTLYGGNGQDRLDGDAGNDTIHGDNGDDVLVGDSGNDLLYGGRGDDDFIFDNRAETGFDKILDFKGSDRLLTTVALNDGGDGLVEFDADHQLNLFGTSEVEINGGAVTQLVVLGTVSMDGATYYAYGLDS
jgi:Ca2+-binding RTX toxin-like protein